MAPEDRNPGIQEVLLTRAGISLSGLYAPTSEPAALVIALHGGGLHSGYFHGRADSGLSLLRLGQQLGYSVLAVDRPGYGASAGIADERTTLEGQARTLWEVVAANFGESAGAGIALLGHSFGSMVALQMAADNSTALDVVGVDVSGIGIRYSDAVIAQTTAPVGRSMHWGDERYYPPGTFDPGVRPHSPMPTLEPEEAMSWPRRAPEVAGKITAPVHLSSAEYEPNWADGLDDLAGLFTLATRVTLDTQARTGHNMSLSWSARAYHLRAFAFFEDSLNERRHRHSN